MGIEDALEAYDRQQERAYEVEQERKARRAAALQSGAEKWATEFLAIDAELAADKVHMLDLIDEETGSNLKGMGFAEVYKLLALDAAGGQHERLGHR